MAAYDREQIIEIMSNPSRQPSHCLHFVSLPELLFQLPVRCDVLGNSRHAVWLAFRIAYQKRAIVDPSHRSVRTDNPIEFLDRFRSLLFVEYSKAVPVLRVHTPHQPIAIFVQGCGTAAPHFLEGWADVKELVCAQVEHPKDLIDVFRQLPKALFALQIGDVYIGANKAVKIAAGREVRNTATQHPPVLSVRPAQPALDAKVAAGVE